MLSDEKNRPMGGFTGSVLSCYRKYTTSADEKQMLINFVCTVLEAPFVLSTLNVKRHKGFQGAESVLPDSSSSILYYHTSTLFFLGTKRGSFLLMLKALYQASI